MNMVHLSAALGTLSAGGWFGAFISMALADIYNKPRNPAGWALFAGGVVFAAAAVLVHP